MSKTVVIVGAGAAGLMAAIHSAGLGRRVLLLERTADGGRKILISGGGRCNVLPSALNEDRYVTASSRPLMKKFLRSWPLAEQKEFFENEIGLPLVLEEETGKLFPLVDKARAVRDALLVLAQSRGVLWHPNVHVVDVKAVGNQWQVVCAHAEPILADAVIIATGGLSVPQTGSDGCGIELCRKLGHTIHPTYPALTPLTLEPPRFTDLAGVSLQATIRGTFGKEKRETSDGFLFTHRGFSGPSVLDISDLATRSRMIRGDLAQFKVQWGHLNPTEWERHLAPSASAVATVVRHHLPARLADRILMDAGLSGTTTLAQLKRGDRLRLIQHLTAYPLPWTGDAGYQKAEVTGGGVALEEVHPKTMESRISPGLYLCGELLDAFGPIGGYNFVWAWITGRLAGRGVI